MGLRDSFQVNARFFFKVTVDLQGCLPENTFFVRCFKENHGKLLITVKVINCRTENNKIVCYFCFEKHAQAFKRKKWPSLLN